MQGRPLARRWPAEPSDLASHTEGCGSAIARLDSLVQGSSGAGETTEEASDAAHEGGEGGAKRRRVDAPPGESSGAVGPPGLPTDVLRSLLPFVCGHRDDPDTLTPQNTIALCRTSEAVSSALEAGVAADIDSIIRHDGLTGVIGYRQVRQSTGVRRLVRRLRLIRLHYLMVAGGDWRGSVPLLRLAKSCGRVQSLPIDLTNDDLQEVGSKAIIDSRPEAIRQYSLFSHRLGDNMQLTRNADGRDELGEWDVVVDTQQTVPARYRFDAADPPCQHCKRERAQHHRRGNLTWMVSAAVCLCLQIRFTSLVTGMAASVRWSSTCWHCRRRRIWCRIGQALRPLLCVTASVT
mmetsp:Transcript_16880/g.40509  ORF Transcript_16880/g.40509 Transcript_16880/m.40509 type:complete len:349 (-) Transcript_16880:17-1063(-)